MEDNPSLIVLSRAEREMRRPEIEIEDLAGVLKNDAAITAEVIKLSNSAYYGARTPSGTISESIHRIGFQEVLKLISLLLTKNFNQDQLRHYGMTEAESLIESVAIALLAEALSVGFKDLDSQTCYTTGLLSTVGKKIINKMLSLRGQDVQYDGTQLLLEWERDVSGFTHAHTGAMLLKQWDFPVDIVEAVMCQFDCNGAHETGESMVVLLSLTRMVYECAGPNLDNQEIVIEGIMPEIMGKCQLDETDLKVCISQAHKKFEAIKSELGIT